MRTTTRPRAVRAGWILAAAITLAACGGAAGNDDTEGVLPPSPPLRDEAAAEAASGAAVSLAAALSALVRNPPDSTGAPARAGLLDAPALVARRLAADTARPGAAVCAGGGTIRATCREGGARTVLVTHADECGVVDAPSGLYVVTDGDLTAEIGARGICRSGEVPPTVPRTLRYRHFRATVRDGPEVLETFAAPVLEQRIEPAASECGTAGRMTFEGRVSLRQIDGVDVTLDAHALSLALTAGGPPCMQQMEATGRLEMFDHASARRFAAALRDVHVAFDPASDALAAAIDGRATLDCVGSVTYASAVPLVIDGPCASGGSLRVTLPSGATARMVVGEAGDVAFDYDNDGRIDRVVAFCLDPSLAACS